MQAEITERLERVDDLLQEVSRIKSVVTDAVEDGFKSALKTVKQGRAAAEDAIDDARHAVKRNPLQALGIAFAIGVALGGLAFWGSSSRR
ncbi:MAG TPA: hypothetical protein VG267_06430 [Terracidiphilus sp.]|jgi:ElaB/YqjD/DUF883 family membrane-anchored ribosome-binding protein|nr:hypothetical protein [Terracidiphilus sp.]